MIYALLPDTGHLNEEEEPAFDAALIEFDGFANARFFNPDVDYHQRFGAPEVLEFVGNLEHASWLDCIGTAPVGFLLISKRMVHVLEAVSPFRYRLIPTTIYSKKIEHLVRDETTGRRTWYQVRDPALRNDDFVVLQLLEQFDCLDRDRTLVAGLPLCRSDREYLGRDGAEHLELRSPEGGFPPVFFVPELLYYCFTDKAKQACDDAGLKGLWWRPQP